MGNVDRNIDYALVFSAAYGARQELTRLAPISREDLALEQDIERAVAS